MSNEGDDELIPVFIVLLLLKSDAVFQTFCSV